MPAHDGRNCPRSEGKTMKNTSNQQNQGVANHLERWKLEKSRVLSRRVQLPNSSTNNMLPLGVQKDSTRKSMVLILP